MSDPADWMPPRPSTDWPLTAKVTTARGNWPSAEERNAALHEQLAEEAEVDAQDECGYAYDHTPDDPKNPVECSECGADLSEWSDEE